MPRPITVFATREEMQRVEMALLLLKRKPLKPAARKVKVAA